MHVVARIELAEQVLTWEGEAPDLGLWHFIAELSRQVGNEDSTGVVRRPHEMFVVVSRTSC